MNCRLRTPWMMVVLSALGLLTFASCGGSTNEGDGPGTETGNPPVIQKAKLRLVVRGHDLRLIGEPGALPAGASLRVTNQRSGVVLETTVASDGSLDVLVEGERTDTFELVAQTPGGETSVSLNATDLPLDLSALSCDGLSTAKDNTVAAAFAEADQTCVTDTDCTSEIWENFCYSRCTPQVASRGGFAAASLEAERRVTPLCEQQQRRGCPGEPVPFCAAAPAVLCEDNRCVAHELEQLDCVERGREAVRERQAIVDRAYRECQVDADCALAGGSNLCLPLCGFSAAVAASASEIIDAELRGLDDSLCAQLEAESCSGAFPPCTEPSGTTRPICVQGQCATSFEPSE